MTGGTRRRNDQALAEQAFPVNALGVVFQDVVLMNHPLALDLSPLLMALGTHLGDLERRDGRIFTHAAYHEPGQCAIYL